MAAFVLRYQEYLETGDTGSIQCGTETLTNVKAEQSDVDPDWSRGVMSVPPVFAGTATVTKILAEQADRDPGKQELLLFPEPELAPALTTQTVTLIQAETADRDVETEGYHVF
jgi:hypothetical protein